MALTKLTTDLIDGSLGTDWQSTPKTADFTAVSGEGYFVDTTSAAITVTLPSSPSAGDEVSIVDYAGTADTNNISITSSDNINGSSNDHLIDYERGGVSMVYVDATQGWIAYNAANETATALDITQLTVDYLVIAGGGSGAGDIGGGGGAGGLRTSYGSTTGGGGSAEATLLLTLATDYAVTIGSGGTGVGGDTNGNNGLNSVFSTITSTGGGGGSKYDTDGSSGGSGGGGGRRTGNGGSAVTSPIVQGYDGGNGTYYTSDGSGGGGGGAGGVGQSLSGPSLGGSSLSVSITGAPVDYAGGGGGGSGSGGGNATGGGAGAGTGGASGGSGSSASVNTGSGGGGGGNAGGSGGSGGSGIVILRYPDAYTITETTSAQLTFTTATDGSDKVTTFTGGDGTIEFTT